MKSKKIKKIFGVFFNGMPNPIYSHPICYFQHKNKLVELAVSADSYELTKASGFSSFEYSEPYSLVTAVGYELFDREGEINVTILEQEGHKTRYVGALLVDFGSRQKINISKVINKIVKQL